MTTDAVLNESANYDISFDMNGDILTADFFDTSILYSLFGERRASGDEMQEPRRRRGWIGNEGKDFENGSLLWLLSQARITTSILRSVEDEASKSLQWLVIGELAVSIDGVTAFIKNGKVMLELTIRRSADQVDRRFFELWNNTGTL